MSAGGDEFMTVAEIAAILKLNPQTIRNWIDHETLPAHHVGRAVRVRRSDFEALLERGRSGETPGRLVTRAPASAQRSPAQAFWEGDLLPRPMVEAPDGE